MGRPSRFVFGAKLQAAEPAGSPAAELDQLPADAALAPAGEVKYLRTGDLGVVFNDALFVVGRIKDVLTIKGRTLHAHDIEVCAERGSHMLRPGCCAALPITAEGGEDTLVLMSEIRPETPTDGAELDQVLRGVSFSIDAGTVCALVGKSGGGKSTMIHLLLRFYDPTAGCITLGGVDYRDLNLRSVHERIGVVTQARQLAAPAEALRAAESARR